MATVVERTESNTASPEGEPDDDIITIASEIASRDMGAEGPPPPPPSQRELREKWGHLPDDMKMSPGGLPMPAELPSVPQSIIDRRNRAESESTKTGLLDRFRHESPVELPSLQPSTMDTQTPENTAEAIKSGDELNANVPAEKARAVMLAKMNDEMAFLTGNQSEDEKARTEKQFKELTDWLPSSGAGVTAQEYVGGLRQRLDAAKENLKKIDEIPHGNPSDTKETLRAGVWTAQEHSAERGRAVQELEMSRWANQNFLPPVVESEETFAPPPPLSQHSERPDAFPPPPPPPRRF